MTGAESGIARHERVLFVALLLLHLAPIWLAGPLVTQDGPSHLSNAWILLRLASGDCPIVSDYFVANWRLSPNWLAHFALAGLGLVLPPVAAEKVIQSVCVAALPLAGRTAIAAIDRGAVLFAIALFPLSLGFPLVMGLYGFCLGVALAVWLYGFWARGRERPRPARLAVLAAGGAVAFFVHPLPLALAVGVVGISEAGLALLLLVLAAPDASPRVGVITDRAVVALLALLVLLGSTAGLPRSAGVYAALLVASALGLLAAKVWKQAELDAERREYLSVGPRLRVGSTLLPIHLRVSGPLGDRSRSPRIDPLVHASGYLAAERCLVSLSNYEATYPAVFPTRFRPALDPYRAAQFDEYAPEWTDFVGYERRTGRAIDQLLVWGDDAAIERLDPTRRAPLRALIARIEADYELVFTTPGRGQGRLYRRREGAAAPEPPPAAAGP